MKKIILLFFALILCAGQIHSQSLLNRIARGAKNAAENAVQRNVERHVEKAVDDAMNPKDVKEQEQEVTSETDPVQEGWTCSKCGQTGNTGKFCSECGTPKAEPASATKNIVSEYIKSDFVPGDIIIFEDLVEGEQLGEFPSKWDLLRGNAEIAKVNGQQVISMNSEDSWIYPLMTNNSKNYLGDVFTLEFDLLYDNSEEDGPPYVKVDFMKADADNEIISLSFNMSSELQDFNCSFVRMGNEKNTQDGSSSKYGVGPLNDGQWHHYAFSFNKRALKIYIDGVRIINIPSAKAAAGWFALWCGAGNSDKPLFLKNVRIAKGAVPLYDRIATEGKIITYAITFETGKAELKPQSYVEINRVAQLMKDNPSLRFEVQGHCDNTGSDKINDPLSQQRAEAIVAALVDQGIAADRLNAVGKGSHVPIADNNTDEGRAKNRRVEFIKK